MAGPADQLLHTDVFSSFEEFTPEPGSLYVFGTGAEARSVHAPEWDGKAEKVGFLEVFEQSVGEVQVRSSGVESRVPLRSEEALGSMLTGTGAKVLYIDITALAHHVWAPLLRVAVGKGLIVRVVYVEPEDYRFRKEPTDVSLFDLSEEIGGLRPIPGFTRLREVDEDATIFVPLLGFEGARFAYMCEKLQPIDLHIFPIVGVPGFRLEFPFHSYLGNRRPLMDTGAWKRVSYAMANDPFAVVVALTRLHADQQGAVMRIAPIGTKPHALGAVLYALLEGERVELVYDHPKRKASRTDGRVRALIYHVTDFLTQQ